MRVYKNELYFTVRDLSEASGVPEHTIRGKIYKGDIVPEPTDGRNVIIFKQSTFDRIVKMLLLTKRPT